MKKICLLFVVLVVFVSCNKNDLETRFEMAYEREFNIPAGLNVFETHYFYLRDIQLGSYLSANNVVASDLNAINPGSARLSTIFSGIGEYDFIRQLSILIYTDDETNAREAFYRTEVPLNAGEDLDVIPSLIDAKQFFENTKFNIIVKLDLRGVPQQSIETRLRFSFLAK